MPHPSCPESRRRLHVGLTTAVAVLIGSLAVASASPAYVAPGALLVSASLQLREQGDDASSQPDLSSDGRYVVFSTTARNLFPFDVQDPPNAFYDGAVFRRDIAGGQLELVALGGKRTAADGTLQRRGAANPSISGDGRWVVFSTGEALVPEDTNEHIDVYVRDMGRARTDPGAYELVSARDGSAAQASYAVREPRAPFRDPGSEVAPAVAISDDGRHIVFETAEVATDLPNRPGLDTPPGQVFARDRELRRTRLVTRVAGSVPPEPVSASASTGAVGLGPAAISPDGSTVAWAGQQAQQQTRFLTAESQDGNVFYYLWQRIADGPDAPTRRITGAVDLDDPNCHGDYVPSASATGACYGPLADTEQGLSGIAATPPALSGDGRRVAFLTQSARRGLEAVAAVDLFVTDMSPGVSRKAGTVEVTREGTSRDPVASGPVVSVNLSADGRWAAVVTPRTRFLVPQFALIGDVRIAAGTNELYLIDLVGTTIERAVRAHTGADADDAVSGQVSASRDGTRFAFASTAENLFFGDANQRSDVFTIDRVAIPPTSPTPDEPAADVPFEAFDSPKPQTRRLTTFVRKAPRGKVRLEVRAPVSGRLQITIRGRLPDRDGRLRGAARTLAKKTRRLSRAGRVTIDLPIASRYRGRLRTAGALDARATLALAPQSGTPLRREIAVRFKAPAAR